MTDQQKKYLSDIIGSIGLIESFMEDVSTFDEYSKDYKTQSAVERQLGIIGEAVNQFEKLNADQDKAIHNAHQIISLRNRIIHAYDAIDDTIVWAILQRYIPPLKEEVIQRMKSE